MGIKVVTAPSVEPVTLAEAKLHLRVDGSDEDALIGRLISAARDQCEQELERSVAPQTLLLTLDAFPAGGIALPRAPVTSIDSVKYIDTAGVLTTIGGANYSLNDTELVPVLTPAYGYTWPATRDQSQAVQVQYVAGWTVVPAAVKQWILLVVGTLYAQRESDHDRPAVAQGFAGHLLDRYRNPSL